MNKKSIDGHAYKALMALETLASEIDELHTIFDAEARIANVKGDEELRNFITQQMRVLNNIENRLSFGKDYLKNLIGLSWDLYGGDITTRTDGDD